MPKKVNRNPGVSKRGDKWKARAFFDGKEYSKTFSTQDEAVRWKREQERALERGEWIDHHYPISLLRIGHRCGCKQRPTSPPVLVEGI